MRGAQRLPCNPPLAGGLSRLSYSQMVPRLTRVHSPPLNLLQSLQRCGRVSLEPCNQVLYVVSKLERSPTAIWKIPLLSRDPYRHGYRNRVDPSQTHKSAVFGPSRCRTYTDASQLNQVSPTRPAEQVLQVSLSCFNIDTLRFQKVLVWIDASSVHLGGHCQVAAEPRWSVRIPRTTEVDQQLREANNRL